MGAVAKDLGLTDTAGAFAAGVLLANSNYKYEIFASILPFKGILLGIFFLDAGSNFDPDLLVREGPTIATGVVFLLVLKALTLGTMGIAQGEGWIGKHARDNPLAVILRERSPEAVAKVLQLTQTPNKEEQAPASELMLRHSGKQFCKAVIGLI
jgi:Kef-type K+ transport system membrane component KefB